MPQTAHAFVQLSSSHITQHLPGHDVGVNHQQSLA